jgi:phage baseplate assembly protein W
MSAPRYRAWRFDALSGISIAPGRVEMVAEDDSVRQAIFLLLSTSPGERVMRPEYGCELQRVLFSPNDDSTAGLAIHYVRQAIARWEPRVEIVRLDAVANLDRAEQLDIALEYRVRSTLRVEELRYSVNLQGE